MRISPMQSAGRSTPMAGEDDQHENHRLGIRTTIALRQVVRLVVINFTRQVTRLALTE
jgi:hypothetical protein